MGRVTFSGFLFVYSHLKEAGSHVTYMHVFMLVHKDPHDAAETRICEPVLCVSICLSRTKTRMNQRGSEIKTTRSCWQWR